MNVGGVPLARNARGSRIVPVLAALFSSVAAWLLPRLQRQR